MNLCLAPYGDTDLHCTDDLGHKGDHTTPTGDGDGVWAWAQVHHPSCPVRLYGHLDDRPQCLCGPEAAAEDAVILAERTPDTMLLDIVAHADRATTYPSLMGGPVGRRLAVTLGLS